VQDSDFALLVRQLGQRLVEFRDELAAHGSVFGTIRRSRWRIYFIQARSTAPLPSAIHVAGPIGDADGQIAFQTAPEPELPARLGEGHEDIVQHILDPAAVVEQGGRDLEQRRALFLVNPAQRRRLPAIEPPHEYSVLNTHQQEPSNSNNRLSTRRNVRACDFSLCLLNCH
jgi:hypothetical protein